LKNQANNTYIFDVVRKKWLVLTPEEWVRQHVLNYLIVEKKYSASSIAIEKELNLNGLKKRYDIVVYSKDLTPHLIIECKAPYISLDQAVVEQALRYNLIVKATLVMITNGVSDFVFNQKQEIIELPTNLNAKEK
jgi:type I site-specific restriction endonuclease